MMIKYLKQNREKFLPWVKNWQDPQDHIRYSRDIKNMDWSTWYYCHPSAYKLMYYGQPAATMVTLSLFALYFFLIDWGVLSFALSIVILYSGKQLYEKIKGRDNIANFTHYDLYMRDYLVTEVMNVKETFKKGYKKENVQSKDEERN